MIIVLFGQPHSGKSTLANILVDDFTSENIDGDILRNIFQNNNYTREGRIINLNRASDIAHYINETSEKHVILSLVYPYKEARDYLNSLTNDVLWVYLTYSGERGRENFHVQDFEAPTEENVTFLDTSRSSIAECIKQIRLKLIFN